MTRAEVLLIVIAILQVAHILQEELAHQRAKQAHQLLMDLLVDFATMVGDIFPLLETLIGLHKDG